MTLNFKGSNNLRAFGQTFPLLVSLKQVVFSENKCKTLSVEKKESEEELEESSLLLQLQKLIESKNAELLNEVILKMDAKHGFYSEIVTRTADHVRLETKLNATEEAKKQAENQAVLIGEIYEKLEAQWNETFTAKVEYFESLLATKLKEVEVLTSQNEKNVQVIHEQSSKIVRLTQKLNDLQRK